MKESISELNVESLQTELQEIEKFEEKSGEILSSFSLGCSNLLSIMCC